MRKIQVYVMFKDRQNRNAFKNSIILVALFIAIALLLDIIFFDIIRILPPKGTSVSCEMGHLETDSDYSNRKYKQVYLWDEADIRYYSFLELDELVQKKGPQVIEILENEILERAEALSQDDSTEVLKGRLNSYEYYNYCLLKTYEERIEANSNTERETNK